MLSSLSNVIAAINAQITKAQTTPAPTPAPAAPPTPPTVKSALAIAVAGTANQLQADLDRVNAAIRNTPAESKGPLTSTTPGALPETVTSALSSLNATSARVAQAAGNTSTTAFGPTAGRTAVTPAPSTPSTAAGNTSSTAFGPTVGTTQIRVVLSDYEVLPATTKTEGTSQTFGQMYQTQVYDADGNLKTKTLSYTDAQKKGFTFNPNAVFSSLSQEELAAGARVIESLSLSKEEVDKAIREALKVDYLLSLKSQESEALEYNLLQTPEAEASFTYNFYTADESDIDIQEDPAKDPFLKGPVSSVPRWVDIKWKPVEAVNDSTDLPTTTPEENAFAQSYFATFGGTSTASSTTIPFAYDNMKRNKPAITREGRDLQLVDSHELQVAFASVSNSKVFKNSAGVVINKKNIDVNKIDFNDLILDDLI